MPFTLEELRGLRDELGWAGPGEVFLAKAADHHLRAAEALQEDFRHHAKLQLMLSIECYLKVLYCKVRYLSFGSQSIDGLKSQGGVWQRLLDGNSLFWAKTFQHDSGAMLRLLTNAVVEFRPESSVNVARSLADVLGPLSQTWPQLRYADPDAQDAVDYRLLLQAYESFRQVVGGEG